MSLRTLSVVCLPWLACGGADLMTPSEVTAPSIHGLVRERGQGPFVAFATESFEAVYDAETVRSPEWSVTGGTLMGNGNSARWQLPSSGQHQLSLTVFLVDGTQVTATWVVSVIERSGGSSTGSQGR
jgi:hypothetical protein